jgi:4-hydroxy-3-methylbut-2-enyl diphosphate reductase
MTDKLLVLAPMKSELRALRKGLGAESVVRTGMGREKSLAAVERLSSSEFDMLVVAGVCGSLDPTFRVGDVLIPTSVSASDVEPTACYVDESLIGALTSAGLTVRTGTLVSHAKLNSNKKATEQHKETGATAVDMESAWLAKAAGDRPVIVLRVASDGPEQPLFHPGIVIWGPRALRRLAKVGRVLGSWNAGH